MQVLWEQGGHSAVELKKFLPPPRPIVSTLTYILAIVMRHHRSRQKPHTKGKKNEMMPVEQVSLSFTLRLLSVYLLNLQLFPPSLLTLS